LEWKKESEESVPEREPSSLWQDAFESTREGAKMRRKVVEACSTWRTEQCDARVDCAAAPVQRMHHCAPTVESFIVVEDWHVLEEISVLHKTSTVGRFFERKL
jgi:hypothetical protein